MKVYVALLLLAAAIALLTPFAAASVGCKDSDGNDVDWWIALKGPDGSRYAYIDSNQSPPAWAYDKRLKLASTSGNPLAETVQQIYGDNGARYLIWNDQPFRFRPKPKIDGALHAHSKGVIGFDVEQGFWLVHSNPNFPDNPVDSDYTGIYNCSQTGTGCGPKSGQLRYAQSYLCLTLDAANIEKAAELIQFEGVVVAGSYLDGTESNFPELNKVLSNYKSHRAKDVPVKQTKNQGLSTVKGQKLLQFAMTPTAQDDDVYMYEQLIEPKLKSGLWVETWKEGNDFPSYCPSVPETLPLPFKYETRTINRIVINNDLEWDNPKTKDNGDHSKWAITHVPGLDNCARDAQENTSASRRHLSSQTADNCAAAEVKIVCIGDINRAGAQLQRGGGTVCLLNNPDLWEAFLPIVAEVSVCGE